jgi:hypothetical protein
MPAGWRCRGIVKEVTAWNGQWYHRRRRGRGRRGGRRRRGGRGRGRRGGIGGGRRGGRKGGGRRGGGRRGGGRRGGGRRGGGRRGRRNSSNLLSLWNVVIYYLYVVTLLLYYCISFLIYSYRPTNFHLWIYLHVDQFTYCHVRQFHTTFHPVLYNLCCRLSKWVAFNPTNCNSTAFITSSIAFTTGWRRQIHT